MFVQAQPNRGGVERVGVIDSRQAEALRNYIQDFNAPVELAKISPATVLPALVQKKDLAQKILRIAPGRGVELGLSSILGLIKAIEDLQEVGSAVSREMGSTIEGAPPLAIVIQNRQTLHPVADWALSQFLAPSDNAGQSTTVLQEARNLEQLKREKKTLRNNKMIIRTPLVKFMNGDRMIINFGSAGGGDPRSFGMISSAIGRALLFDTRPPDRGQMNMLTAPLIGGSELIKEVYQRLLNSASTLPPTLKGRINQWIRDSVQGQAREIQMQIGRNIPSIP